MAVPPQSLHQSSIWPTPRGGMAIAMQATSSVTMATERVAERHRNHPGANDQAVLEARCMGQMQPCILDAYNKVPLLPRVTAFTEMTERSRVRLLLVDPESKAKCFGLRRHLRKSRLDTAHGGSRGAVNAGPPLTLACQHQ